MGRHGTDPRCRYQKWSRRTSLPSAEHSLLSVGDESCLDGLEVAVFVLIEALQPLSCSHGLLLLVERALVLALAYAASKEGRGTALAA